MSGRSIAGFLPARMHRSCLSGVVAGIVGLTGAAQAVGEPACKPTLAFEEVHFSEMQPPTMERKWTAIVSVDASRCAANSAGHFEIVFMRLKEVGIDVEFRERFKWRPPAVKVEVGFAADEAVQRFRLDNIAPCACRG